VTIPADLEFEVEDVTFESEDGLTIAGWHVPSQNGATIILLHGYGGNRTSTIWHAGHLVQAGYGVLMYDERASGESEGTYRSYGWEDTRDTSGAIRFLFDRADLDEQLGILGCSTGADIALRSAAYFPELGAVWADGASSVRAQDLPSPTNPLIALLIAGNYTLDWMYSIKLGIEPPEPLIHIIDDIAPRPIMLVGGGTPRPLFGSEADLYTLRYSELAGPNAEAWIIPEATHCNGRRVRPEEYAARMIAFFNDAFGLK
jgi:pimeloyl-ACP methyl ester carboxylesterase